MSDTSRQLFNASAVILPGDLIRCKREDDEAGLYVGDSLSGYYHIERNVNKGSTFLVVSCHKHVLCVHTGHYVDSISFEKIL